MHCTGRGLLIGGLRKGRRTDDAGELTGGEQEFTTIGRSRPWEHSVFTIALLLFGLAAGDMARLSLDHFIRETLGFFVVISDRLSVHMLPPLEKRSGHCVLDAQVPR